MNNKKHDALLTGLTVRGAGWKPFQPAPLTVNAEVQVPFVTYTYTFYHLMMG
jgi:hypothetical protein